MILSELNTPFDSSEQTPESTHDWQQDRANYSDQQIHEMPTWIKSKKDDTITNYQYEVVDLNSFSEMQELAYNIVKYHFNDTSISSEKQPLCLIVIGVAGTGKSYLINGICTLLQSKCAVTATTGKAAYNIKGVTVHSLLKLPIGSRGRKDLTGQSLCRLQLDWIEPVIFLAKGAIVMLTMNLWPSVGLCNGATGTVIAFIFKNNHQPPALPIAVIVQFENYTGPSLIDTQPSYVPVCPIAVSSQTENGFHERQQLPLRLAWALTIHKSQGLTLPKAWIDIGKSERTAGVSYVAISRVKTLTSCIIEPMTYQRLTSLKSSVNLQFRLQEEDRLHHFAEITHSSFSNYHHPD